LATPDKKYLFEVGIDLLEDPVFQTFNFTKTADYLIDKYVDLLEVQTINAGGVFFDDSKSREITVNDQSTLITGLGRINGQSVGIIANQPRVKGGVLFHDSADKAAKFISLCDAFNIPLLFLADVPGFMIGTQVEKAGIIRHGAKMIFAMSEATVPKLTVIVRKAYGAGLYAMAGPAFEPDCCIALSNAQIAVMGPEAAVNAVYANKIAELPKEEQASFIAEKRKEYQEEIDVYRLASELIIDDVIEPNDLRKVLESRLELYMSKYLLFSERKHGVNPV
ncbi:carboxyl transferase domain-containing protein, partial [Lysinibacillus xylanilyticus]|uniref:carboxyl transferase domain-containing protein n=1 Tax=Lysinibacillus xylanilyticus TaxID=582475 RepID=UPI002FCDAE1D